MDFETFVALLLLAYFVPTVIALARGHHNFTPIIVVNVLLWWTFIG